MIFYTILTSWLIAIFSLLATKHLWLKRNYDDWFLGCFWLLVSLMWLLGGSRALLDRLGIYQISEVIPYVVQIITAVHVIPLALLIVLRLTRNLTFAKYGGYLTGIFVISYLYYIFKDGLDPTIQTIYGPSNQISTTAALIFQTIFFFGLPLLIFDFLFCLYKSIVKFSSDNLYYFLPILALTIYCFGGYFNQVQLELKYDWEILLLRLIYLISVLITYIYATGKKIISYLINIADESKINF